MARKYIQGTYVPINPDKWIGNKTPTYRSSWEKMTFKWADLNPDVVAVASEKLIIPYLSEVDDKIHRYYLDLMIKYKSGSVVLVEIKPASQARAPKATQGKSKKVLMEEMNTWKVNSAKWKAAEGYAKRNGAVFQVWTEDVLRAIGINVK